MNQLPHSDEQKQDDMVGHRANQGCVFLFFFILCAMAGVALGQ